MYLSKLNTFWSINTIAVLEACNAFFEEYVSSQLYYRSWKTIELFFVWVIKIQYAVSVISSLLRLDKSSTSTSILAIYCFYHLNFLCLHYSSLLNEYKKVSALCLTLLNFVTLTSQHPCWKKLLNLTNYLFVVSCIFPAPPSNLTKPVELHFSPLQLT